MLAHFLAAAVSLFSNHIQFLCIILSFLVGNDEGVIYYNIYSMVPHAISVYIAPRRLILHSVPCNDYTTLLFDVDNDCEVLMSQCALQEMMV